ncbi:MAG TPA: hypothetical protein VLC46_04705 [Thermoanaerobaculia bacterium]|jgi:hypothetical protein|nr:hypothetical protein [Thermoanaerobaculia bacterium]
MEKKTEHPVERAPRHRLRTLPAHVVVHPRLVVTRQSGEAIVKQMNSGKTTTALRDLMGGED